METRYVIIKVSEEEYNLEDQFGLVGREMSLPEVFAEITDKEGVALEEVPEELNFD
jgi:hypothetical protein